MIIKAQQRGFGRETDEGTVELEFSALWALRLGRDVHEGSGNDAQNDHGE